MTVVNTEQPIPSTDNSSRLPGPAVGAATAAPGSAVANRQRRHDDRPDVWRLAHRALRGRYRLALALAAVGMVAGAQAGMRVGQRLYRATGLVRIAAVRPQVMKETDQNRAMPMFDGIIQAQQDVMSSRETVRAATRDPAWQGTVGHGGRAITEEQFAASLKVETRPRSDHLRVMYTDPDARVAAAAVRAIIGAYQRGYDAEQDRIEQQRHGELEARRAG